MLCFEATDATSWELGVMWLTFFHVCWRQDSKAALLQLEDVLCLLSVGIKSNFKQQSLSPKQAWRNSLDFRKEKVQPGKSCICCGFVTIGFVVSELIPQVKRWAGLIFSLNCRWNITANPPEKVLGRSYGCTTCRSCIRDVGAGSKCQTA